MKKNVFTLIMISVTQIALWSCTHIEDLPSVQISQVSEITQTTATAGGSILANGANVTVRGVCFSASNDNPTIDDLHTIDGCGTGDFKSLLTALQENTTYYVRAYAMNNSGISYGNVVSFSTMDGSYTSSFEGEYFGNFEYLQSNTTSTGNINFTCDS